MQLNAKEIQKILPHKYPFLLIDKVIDYSPGKCATAIKCVSSNEMQFIGHFPNNPIMPGVLIIEALAQTGAVALLTEDENTGKLVYFGGINNAKFKKIVTPGDVLELRCDIIKKIGNIGKGKAEAFVDGLKVVEAELTFAIE